nr:carbohydrate-binding protein [Acidobacteriota bacterium]
MHTVRREFLDLNRLQVSARLLAARLLPIEPRSGWSDRPTHLARLDREAGVLERAYRAVAADVHRGEAVSPAAEWLLDNFHLIASEVRSIHQDVPRGYYRRLPKVVSAEARGAARVAIMATDLIAYSDGRLDAERLRGFVLAFQSVAPLTIGELWAWPSMLKAALVSHASALSDGIRSARDDHARADAYLAALDDTRQRRPTPPIGPDSGFPFIVRLLQRIREYGPHAAAVRAELDTWLAERQMTPEDAIRVEGQREAADQLSMANTITSLRFCAAHDWTRFVESVSQVEEVLHHDPVGVYGRMDFASRDRYRRSLEALADGTGEGQIRVAQRSVDAARRASARDPGGREAHVGYYLIGGGRSLLERQLEHQVGLRDRVVRSLFHRPTLVYLGSIALITVALVAVAIAYGFRHGGSPATLAWVALLVLIPASDVATAVVQRLMARVSRPRRLPRLDLERGIPESGRTMVIVPTLFDSPAAVEDLLSHLEVQALGNLDARLHFGVLSDYTDADAQHMPGDEAILAAARAGVADLNARHGSGRQDRFYLFHRDRRWNEKEARWMGWERKRGKIEEFNRLLRGASDTGFDHVVGDRSVLPEVRYCITLDSDTRLPRDSARELIGIILHPLNQPHVDPVLKRVTQGYGILQPRVSVTMSSAAGSLFARVYAGHTGVDPYTTAVSDSYQDLFGEGIFAGKGLYHVDAFKATLDGRVPENALLSHDLFEGVHARAALVSDIEFVDDYPASVLTHVRRQRRWVRGDWQILLWLFPFVPTAHGMERNRLPLISRWKIFDNLRRSLVPPSLLAFLVAGWIALPGRPVVWTSMALAVAFASTLLGLARMFATPWARRPFNLFMRRLTEDVETSAAQALLSLMLLPFHAWEMVHAIVQTLIRLAITQRRLLEWETAASVAARAAGLSARSGMRTFAVTMAVSPMVAVGAAIAVSLAPRNGWIAATPFILGWLAAPAIAYWLSQPRVAHARVLGPDDRVRLRRLARKTWHYFEVLVGPDDHWLPPDNFQETDGPRLARRTSPTNIGMGLLAALAAHDLGFVTTDELADRTEGSLDTCEGLERHEGHLLNWYDTSNLSTLWPRYVSTVDSGNLVTSLITLAAGLDAAASRPQTRLVLTAGLADTAAVVKEMASRLGGPTPTPRSVAEALDAVASRVLTELRSTGAAVWEGNAGPLVQAIDDLLALPDARREPGNELPVLSWAHALRAALLRVDAASAADPANRLLRLAQR